VARDARLPLASTLSAWLAAALGGAWFVFLAGRHVLDVTRIDWLLRHDWSQHYLAWAFFRATRAPFGGLPLGQLPEVVEPAGTTLALMDGNPLWSFAFGTLSSVLPTRFQFLGWYLLTNFVLQGYFGARLTARLGAAPACQWLGGLLFVGAPVLLQRVAHDTLTSQWLLLWVLMTYFPGGQPTSERHADGRRLGLALLVGAWTHAYLLAMLLPLAWGSVVARARRASWREATTEFAGTLAGTGAAGASLWALGLLGAAGHSGASGFGFFSANLLAPFDPSNWSTWLGPLVRLPNGQRYEGFGYVGLGGLWVLAAALLVGLWRRRRPVPRAAATGEVRAPALGPPRRAQARNGVEELLLVAAGLFLYALSDRIYCGATLVADLHRGYDALGPLARLFRSSGRFVWPLGYALVAVGLSRCLRQGRLLGQLLLLVPAVALQAAEVDRAAVHAQFVSPQVRPLGDPLWQAAWGDYQHVALIPPWFPGSDVRCGYPYRDKYEVPLLLFAAEHGMGTNCAYLSHYDQQAVQAACQRDQQQFAGGRFRADTLYVVPPELTQNNDMAAHHMRCGVADGYVVCVLEGARPTALARQLAARAAPPAVPAAPSHRGAHR
jgi:hypothetical protein